MAENIYNKLYKTKDWPIQIYKHGKLKACVCPIEKLASKLFVCFTGFQKLYTQTWRNRTIQGQTFYSELQATWKHDGKRNMRHQFKLKVFYLIWLRIQWGLMVVSTDNKIHVNFTHRCFHGAWSVLSFSLKVNWWSIFYYSLHRHLNELIKRVQLLSNKAFLIKVRTDDNPTGLLPQVHCDFITFIILIIQLCNR